MTTAGIMAPLFSRVLNLPTMSRQVMVCPASSGTLILLWVKLHSEQPLAAGPVQGFIFLVDHTRGSLLK